MSATEVIVLQVVLLAQLAWAGPPEMIPEQESDVVGRTAPPVEDLEMMDGSRFSLSQLRGKPVILSFWASWCGPCRHEMPALDAWSKERPDLTIVAVNVDRERRLAERFLDTLGSRIDLPIAFDNQAVALGGFSVSSMPTVFLIDARGTVKYRKVGFSQEHGLTELQEAVAALR